jgi:integrase
MRFSTSSAIFKERTMKYTKILERKDGTKAYVFVPPEAAIKAGIVKRKTFRDGNAARYEIPRLIQKVEAFRRGDLASANLGPESKFLLVVPTYLESLEFLQHSRGTQYRLDATLRSMNKTWIKDIPIKDIDYHTCKKLYEEWRFKPATKNKVEAFNNLMNWAKKYGYVEYNPMVLVDKDHRTRTERRWTQEQVEKFLDAAFTKFEWRNTGLMVLMVYEWGMAPHKVAKLTWSDLDLEAGTRPGGDIQEPLLGLLKEHKETYDFQSLVVPYHKKNTRRFTTLYGTPLSLIMRQVKEAAGLPSDLTLTGLRKTK